MKISRILKTSNKKKIEAKIKTLLKTSFDLSKIEMPFEIGNYLIANFDKIFGDISFNYSLEFARRAMADLTFKDKAGFCCVVDVKNHREDTKFNMPNLTSVEQLARFYEDDLNYFVMLLVKYKLKGTHAVISDVTFVPIEFFDWDCLTVGALGVGQIQIANSNYISIKPRYSRKKWMLELCDVMLEFYPKEIDKIHSRIGYFERLKNHWQKKLD